MSEQEGKRRVLLCGPPCGGKKDILDGLARHMGAAMPDVIEPKEEWPTEVAWQATFPSGIQARFETFYGPGWRRDSAIVEKFSSPVSAVIYVLRQMEPEFVMSYQSEENEFYELANVAAEHGRSWNDIPWLFVKSQFRSLHPEWLTELVPPELADAVLTVGCYSGAGIPELFHAIDRMLIRAR